METSSANERLTASLLYFLSFFTAIIGPAILWYIHRHSPYVHQHGLYYLNFSVSYFLYQAAAGFLYFIGIGIIINAVLTVLMVIFMVIGGIFAYQGKQFKIPLVIRFFS
ncbi:DUF4870 domain-containing protein [Jeotgalibacillus sp. S-D1]|uniref:DUF4870 domain-containing protein n=1 Tax=Jeotgalibacillus sp. S-D1 TaxID=2552189 RepID=UPI001059F2DF|nr:DUF4870 domain-containing protein [Jeotgalibacillus sp. S-D1]TDL31533.1 DUF4870 domain-containing protein [Jeotgalibacillus sp. S-D1]